MDVVIGRVPPAGGPSDKASTSRGQIEARVLQVRQPRSRRHREGGPGHTPKRRRGSSETDPLGARVLMLLVPEGHLLPEDLQGGDYRVFLRLVRK